jgi:hypothetical protein
MEDNMKSPLTSHLLPLAVALALVAPRAAVSAEPTFEVGATIMNGTVALGDSDFKVFGVPAGSVGLLSPGVFASIYLGSSRIAIEPQFGLVWVSSHGESSHLLNFSGQIDWFVMRTGRASPYVFASAGVVDLSDSDVTPKAYSGGVGYRVPIGDRLTFRFDGRYIHFTEGGGNAVAFAVSIGGVLGRK